jgi:predicted nucleic acid-binding protein
LTVVYVETSALVAWLLREPTGERARAVADAAETLVTSQWTWAEVERVLVRGQSSGALREGDAQRLRGTIARQKSRWMSMALSDAVLARLGRPFPVEPLRTLDALHLATALELARAFPDLRVLTLDRRIAENATALGIGA